MSRFVRLARHSSEDAAQMAVASNSHDTTRQADHGYGVGRGTADMIEYIADHSTPDLMNVMAQIDQVLAKRDVPMLQETKHRIEAVLAERGEPLDRAASTRQARVGVDLMEFLKGLVNPGTARRLEQIGPKAVRPRTTERPILDILGEQLETPTRLDPHSNKNLPVQTWSPMDDDRMAQARTDGFLAIAAMLDQMGQHDVADRLESSMVKEASLLHTIPAAWLGGSALGIPGAIAGGLLMSKRDNDSIDQHLLQMGVPQQMIPMIRGQVVSRWTGNIDQNKLQQLMQTMGSPTTQPRPQSSGTQGWVDTNPLSGLTNGINSDSPFIMGPFGVQPNISRLFRGRPMSQPSAQVGSDTSANPAIPYGPNNPFRSGSPNSPEEVRANMARWQPPAPGYIN